MYRKSNGRLVIVMKSYPMLILPNYGLEWGSLKVRHAERLMLFKSVEAQSPHVDAVWRLAQVSPSSLDRGKFGEFGLNDHLDSLNVLRLQSQFASGVGKKKEEEKKIPSRFPLNMHCNHKNFRVPSVRS
ncbi:hypothetical protein TNCV_4520281 [Trichonephila clavipes]|nr:hypothetical protein TNCV_4520281 [Trichonephila clavipes]